MSLVELITEDVVKTPLISKTKPQVLQELVQMLADAGKITDTKAVLAAVMEREGKQSTGLESGIAVPHGKTSAVKRLVLAVGISKAGVDFNSMDGKPSRLFFMLIAPPNRPGPHVEALAEIAKLSRSQSLCSSLIDAADAKGVVELLRAD